MGALELIDDNICIIGIFQYFKGCETVPNEISLFSGVYEKVHLIVENLKS